MGLKELGIDEIRKRAKRLREKVYSREKTIRLESEKDRFCKENAIAPIIATICDQWINADDAFEFPLWLSKQLEGDLSAELIMDAGEEKIRHLLEVFMADRWPSSMEKERRGEYLKSVPEWIIKTCKKIIERFDGNPDNMFKKGSYTPSELYFILRGLDGIAQKKASMIVRDFIEGITPWAIGLRERLKREGIDFKVEGVEHSSVPVDTHVVRVFCRIVGEDSGALKDEDILKYYPDIQYFAKMTCPEFPANVDGLLWEVGRKYCRAYRPNCRECPLRDLPCEYAKRL